MNKILSIKTPESLQQFNNGEIGAGYTAVYFFPGAHPDIMSLPKLLANNTSFVRFRFEDEDENVITLEPKQFRAHALFMKAENLTFALPNDYVSYQLLITRGTVFSSHDFDCLLQWKEMTSLGIQDRANLAYGLSQRISQLKQKLPYLRNLFLTRLVDPAQEWEVNPFITELPAINEMGVYIEDLTLSQATKFLCDQLIPLDFSAQLFYNWGYIEFLRRDTKVLEDISSE